MSGERTTLRASDFKLKGAGDKASNIERSRRLLERSEKGMEPNDALRVIRGGDNFTFVCAGDFIELKLWALQCKQRSEK